MSEEQGTLRGILVPVLTPFKPDLCVDMDAFVRHCRWLLERGADALAVFGTTSEANSLGIEERLRALDALIEAGVPPSRLLPGTGTCAISDTARLTAHAVTAGCAGVLMLPPFYYKAVDDEGLYASFSTVIEQVGDSRLKIYLYHIPPVAQVPISLALIGRLLRDYPSTVVGLKDSSGDWSNTSAVLREYPSLATFCGSEVFLLQTLRNGGAGSITATANANPAGIRALYERWRQPEAEELQARITAQRRKIERRATIPALKAIAAAFYAAPDWRLVRPPLCALSEADAAALLEEIEGDTFDMALASRVPDSATRERETAST